MHKRPRLPGMDLPHAASDPITIRATCPDCGDVRFPSGALTIHIAAGSGDAHVSYLCPDCGIRTAQRVPGAVLDTLRRAGVRVRCHTRPAEADEAHNGPPISAAEVAAFASALRHPGWEAKLTG